MPERRTRTAYRIAAYCAGAFAAVSLLLGAVTWGFAHRTLRRTLDDRLRSELSSLEQASVREGRAALIEDIVARDAGPSGGDLMFDRAGRRVAGAPVIALPPEGLSDVVLRGRGADLPGRVAARRLAGGETIAVVGEAASLAKIERTLLAITGAGFALMVAIGVGGGFVVGHSIHRRLSAVDDAARAIIDGDLTRRMPIGARNDEFDRLSATLNRMLDHIGVLMDSLRHVSDDVAHDLRTPLAQLRATLEAARDGHGESARRASLSEALTRTDAVIALFAAILRISEVQRGGARARFAPLRLDRLVRGLVDDYAPAILDGGRTLAVRIEDAIVLRGDHGLLGQAVVNLLENAIKHTPTGTRIAATLGRRDGGVVLTIADDGPGVPAGDRPLVLRRFGRREASRTTPGHGLGLTLVAAVAAAHDAALRLDDAAPGLAVSLVFPDPGFEAIV